MRYKKKKKKEKSHDTHLARGRQTTLQEADGMRSSEDDLASPEGGVGDS
jgi:hypothetical protein